MHMQVDGASHRKGDTENRDGDEEKAVRQCYALLRHSHGRSARRALGPGRYHTSPRGFRMLCRLQPQASVLSYFTYHLFPRSQQLLPLIPSLKFFAVIIHG